MIIIKAIIIPVTIIIIQITIIIRGIIIIIRTITTIRTITVTRVITVIPRGTADLTRKQQAVIIQVPEVRETMNTATPADIITAVILTVLPGLTLIILRTTDCLTK